MKVKRLTVENDPFLGPLCRRLAPWCRCRAIGRQVPQTAIPAMLSQLRRYNAKASWRAHIGVVMRSRLFVLACALVLLPAQALAGAKETIAALAPSGLVLAMDEKGNELVA